MAVERDSLTIDGPVRIAFDNLAIAVPRFGATARIADAGQRYTHDIALCGCNGSYAAAMTS
jgi:hypothetical protein